MAPRAKATAQGTPDSQRVHRHRHDDGRGQHQPHRQQPDRPRVGGQLARRGEEGGREEERRQEEEEDDVGRQLDARQPRQQPERQATQRHQDRVRDPDAPSGDSEQRHQQQERQDQLDRLDGVHAASLARFRRGLHSATMTTEPAVPRVARPPSEFLSEKIRSLQPSGIRRFFDMLAEMKDVISLTIGEPDFTTPEPITRAAIASLEAGETHYTANGGMIVAARGDRRRPGASVRHQLRRRGPSWSSRSGRPRRSTPRCAPSATRATR